MKPTKPGECATIEELADLAMAQTSNDPEAACQRVEWWLQADPGLDARCHRTAIQEGIVHTLLSLSLGMPDDDGFSLETLDEDAPLP